MKSSSFNVSSLSQERFQLLSARLEKLHREVAARCTILADSDGHLITSTGNLERFPTQQIIPLLVGSMAGAIESGQILDKHSEIINLVYLESKTEYLYAVNVGSQLLLIIVVDRSPFSTRLGTVWYAGRKTAEELLNILKQPPETTSSEILQADFAQSLETELDKLLFSGVISAEEPPANTPQPFTSTATQPAEEQPEIDTSSLETLLSFSDALSAGLLEEHTPPSPQTSTPDLNTELLDQDSNLEPSG